MVKATTNAWTNKNSNNLLASGQASRWGVNYAFRSFVPGLKLDPSMKSFGKSYGGWGKGTEMPLVDLLSRSTYIYIYVYGTIRGW